jgi:3-hydroxyisobutyrate dehydrogenase
MLAGAPEALDEIEKLLAPMCASTFRCGEVPRALETKLAVNVFLITMVTGLAEAARFAEHIGLDLEVFRSILDAGPMASAVSRVKLAKLVDDDLSPQASIRDVHYNARLILGAAQGAEVTLPLLDVCGELFGETEASGHGTEDMIAVIRAIRGRQAGPMS